MAFRLNSGTERIKRNIKSRTIPGAVKSFFTRKIDVRKIESIKKKTKMALT